MAHWAPGACSARASSNISRDSPAALTRNSTTHSDFRSEATRRPPRAPLRNPSLSPLRSPIAKPQTDPRSPVCPAWRRRRTASPRTLCPLPRTRTHLTAPLLTDFQQTRTRTDRSAAAPGCAAASSRTCHLQAHTQQPHRLARAGDDLVC